MAFTQAHLDAVNTAVNELTAITAQRTAAKAKLQAALDALSAEMKEGDIRSLNGRVPAVQKKDGVVSYVMVPGILDPDPTS